MELNDIFAAAKRSSQTLVALDDMKINRLLCAVAQAMIDEKETIIGANKKDLELMALDNPKRDRLMLDEKRLQGMADGVREVAMLPSPVGRLLYDDVRPNGLHIRKESVSFGVIGIIFEARPNVGLDVFSLCLKSKNACILKGGSDAHHSNTAIVNVIKRVLDDNQTDLNVVTLLPAGRESAAALLSAHGFVDLIIPRGSSSLINFVRNNATLPVIETGAGVCHTYFDSCGNVAMGAAIIHNAKTRRVSVCNALDCLLIDITRLTDLPALCLPMQSDHVVICADEPAFAALSGSYPDSLLLHSIPDDYGTEFLDYKMSIKSVEGLDGAMSHIARYGSKHSECIVTDNADHAKIFCESVDAACVYVNAPTSFTDGAQFGLGAEVGISTQKLHARGPMGVEELTTYKWIIEGEGQVRG